MNRTSEQVDKDMLDVQDGNIIELRGGFADRLNAGLPLTLEEWRALGDNSKDVWEECYTEWQLKTVALNAHFLADSIKGGTLAVEAVWDILPANVQDRYLAAWSTKNVNKD